MHGGAHPLTSGADEPRGHPPHSRTQCFRHEQAKFVLSSSRRRKVIFGGASVAVPSVWKPPPQQRFFFIQMYRAATVRFDEVDRGIGGDEAHRLDRCSGGSP